MLQGDITGNQGEGELPTIMSSSYWNKLPSSKAKDVGDKKLLRNIWFGFSKSFQVSYHVSV
jgi:hypothetical protein